MPTANEPVIRQLKTWAAPILLSIAAFLGLTLWNQQLGTIQSLNERIISLEEQLSNAEQALAVINSNQENSTASRTDFQKATSDRLDRMEDVLTQMGQNLAALTAIQQRQDQETSK